MARVLLDEDLYDGEFVRKWVDWRGFMRALERLIERVNRYDEQAALLFVDLDGLKLINDTFGHQAGDKALIQVARMLVDDLIVATPPDRSRPSGRSSQQE